MTNTNLTTMLENISDKIVDPTVKAKYYVHKMEKENEAIFKSTADALASANGVQRKIDLLDREIEKMDRYARLAIKENKEDDARKFLSKKEELEDKKFNEEKNSAGHWNSAARLLLISDREYRKLKNIKDRTEQLENEKALADVQNSVIGIEMRLNSDSGYKAGYDKNVQKVYKYIDDVDARRALIDAMHNNDVYELTQSYDSKLCDENVEMALLELKKEIHGVTAIEEKQDE